MREFKIAMSEKAEELFDGFTPAERRLYGKLANSSDPIIYLCGILDTMELNGIEISEAFNEFTRYILENFGF